MWFRSYPKISLAIFVVVVMIILLILAEVTLRLNGFQPGETGNNEHFYIVDSVSVDRDYIADKYGINKVDPQLKDTLHHYIKKIATAAEEVYTLQTKFSFQDMISEFSLLQYSPEVLDSFILTYSNRRELIDGDSLVFKILSRYETDFYYYIKNLQQKNSSALTAIDSAYLHYAAYPINSDGFRSIEFKNYDTDQPKVLLLGDSFTWGLSARPIMNSIPDLLATKGFAVFNTGIIGSDPAQYLAVAEQFIGQIQPDIVCVNFYTLNDVMYFSREMKPYQMFYYTTSAGWLWACPKQEYLPDAETAYKYYEEHKRIPVDLNSFNALCSKSVLTTYFWKLLVKYFIIKGYSEEFAAYDYRNRNVYLKASIAEEYLKKIKVICDQNGAKFLLVLIPDYEQLNSDLGEVANIRELKYYVPDELVKSDYNLHPDGHFNNSGHRKYADFLERHIKRLLSEDGFDD